MKTNFRLFVLTFTCAALTSVQGQTNTALTNQGQAEMPLAVQSPATKPLTYQWQTNNLLADQSQTNTSLTYQWRTDTNAAAINATNTPATIAAGSVKTNTAIVPVPRPEAQVQKRTETVLQRAKDHPGKCDIVFIGDSITQGWEGSGKKVWTNYYGKRNVINLGVGGDRTQHVLWRFENGQLDGLKPKVAVVMIGTNNSNGKDNTEAEILEGVRAIVNQIRERLPNTKILLFGIFPRSSTFSMQRGKILQVNEALAKLDDGKMIFYMDIGPQLIEADGSISKSIMPDFLHPNEAGYEIWASAMEPKLKKLLRH